jgi:protein-S-isoprenylcysteine O-methyltransferase Ste14
MVLRMVSAALVAIGAAVVVYIYHFRMNRLDPGDRQRVTNWRFYSVIDWYLQISALVFSVTAILGSHPLLLEFHDSAGLLAAGLAVAGAGLALFVYAIRNLDRQYTPGHAAHLPTEIITAGPYRYIRHPVYTANLLMTAGLLMASGTLWLGLNLAVLVVYYHFAIKSEENSIAAHFPEYREYAARTGRLFPRISRFFTGGPKRRMT